MKAPSEDMKLGIAIVLWLILGLLVLGELVLGPVAWAESSFYPPLEENPRCDASAPAPPLIAHLPDGSTIPITRVEYDPATRVIHLWGYTRVFCDGFED